MLLREILAPRLDRETSRSHAIDGQMQVFMALRFYASGTVHHTHGDHHDIIKFPTTPAEVAASQSDCNSTFSKEDGDKLCRTYWKTGEYNQQWDFLRMHVQNSEEKNT